MVDASDLKSDIRKGVWVRVPSAARIIFGGTVMQYLKVGEKHVDPESTKWIYEKEWYRQGFVYKDEEAYLTSKDDVCYIAENDYREDEQHYNRTDILRIANGDLKMANMIFYLLDWQHPETVYDELTKEINNERN